MLRILLVTTWCAFLMHDVEAADLEYFRNNFVNIDNMRQDATHVYLENIHGVPTNSYTPGICNPNDATAQYRSVTLPRRPQRLVVPRCLPMGSVGFAINSVAFYHPLTGEHANAVDGGTTEGFDICGGHADPTESYHYHKLPEKHLNPKEINGNSLAPEHDECPYTVGQVDKLLGVALDGFLIYGPIVTIRGVRYDFRYSNTLANDLALDECHGTEIDAENGEYVYVVNDVYPYIMGCFRGLPSLMFPFTDQTYECTTAATGELCDCCKGQLTREDVTDDNEPCHYECTYTAPRVKRQISAPLPPRPRPRSMSSLGFGSPMEQQQPRQRSGNALMELFQRPNRLPVRENRWYSFNRQDTQTGNLPDGDPAQGVVVPQTGNDFRRDNNDRDDDDNNGDDDNDFRPDDNDNNGDDDDVDPNAHLPHCRPVRGPPPQDRQGQPGRPPKRGPPPNGGQPPPKKGGQDCPLNGLRMIGRRRKRAATAALETLIRKLASYN